MPGAFNGGGSQVGDNWSNEDRWELQDVTSVAHGTHAFKFGGRMRQVTYDESSPKNFGGTFTFAGDGAAGILRSSSIGRLYRIAAGSFDG